MAESPNNSPRPDDKPTTPSSEFAYQELIDPAPPEADSEDRFVDELDPANRSLADAMRVSFTILSVVMVLLATLFLLSGSFRVQENQVAVRVLFGKILEDSDGNKVIRSGGPHFFPPQPIGEVIYVPTTIQTVDIRDTFWMYVRPEDRARPIEQLPVRTRGLRPGIDGSLITADQNLVHGQFAISFKIDPENAAQFVENIGDLDRAAEVVRAAAQSAIVRTVASVTAEDFRNRNISRDQIKILTQQTLRDEMRSGITITDVTMPNAIVPLQTRDAFFAVTQAQAEKQEAIDQAITERTRVLNAAAGPAYPALIALINLYERARQTDDAALAEKAESAINRLFEGETSGSAVTTLLTTEPKPNWIDWPRYEQALRDATAGQLQSARIGDQAARILQEATSFRTGIIAETQGAAEQFKALLEEYRRNPAIVINRRWNDTREQILQNVLQKWYLPDDPTKTLYIELAPDPRIERERERERYIMEQQRE